MKKIKVVQCWDDATYNDIRLVGLLRKYNAKATFNLNPGLMTDEPDASYWFDYRTSKTTWYFNGYHPGRVGLKDIKKLYEGFEIASHCYKHENANTMPPEEWIKTALKARHYLEDVFERPCTGFAWPCGITTPETCTELRKAGFTYGRTTQYTDFVTECEDVMAMPTNCHFANSLFFEKYEKARECGVFYFWGHSYEMYDYDKMWNLLEDKIAFISNDPDAEWVNINDIIPLCKGK